MHSSYFCGPRIFTNVDPGRRVTCPTTPASASLPVPTTMQLRFKADRHSAAVHPSIHLSFRCVRSYSCTHAPTEMTRARDNGTEQMGWQDAGEERQALPSPFSWLAAICTRPSQFVLASLSFVRSFVPSYLSLHLKSSIIFGAIGSKMPKSASFPRY